MKTTKFYNTVSRTPERAVIEISGTIGGFDWDERKRTNTGDTIRAQLKEMEGVKELNVLICSLGGSLGCALQIHDALKDFPAKVTTVINGFCASAATVVALAGDVRKISRNALYLIHKCVSETAGNEHDLEMELESQKTCNETLLNLYRSVCKKPEAELLELFDYDNGNGKWITAQEAVDFGFCTEIYNDQNTTAKMNSIIDKMRDLFAQKIDITNLKTNEMDERQNLQAAYDELKASFDAKMAEMDTLTADVKAKAEDIAGLKETITALTAERDDYKTKWENAPPPSRR